MNLRKYSRFKFGVTLGIGAAIALVLCVQCVRTFLYADSVLIPRQAEHEAERQAGALTAAARSAGITDPRLLRPVIQHALESSSDRVLWMRVLDLENNIVAQGGNPQGKAYVSAQWWERFEKHESVGRLVDTPEGKALVAMFPFRIPRPDQHAQNRGAAEQPGSPDWRRRPPGDRRAAYVIELAVPLKAVASAFDGFRENLIVGLIAAIALLVAVGMIALRAPHYLRGKYLESELRLAQRVQSDLQPKPHSVSPHVQFAASAVAADHIGGDFHDIFEAESGEIAIVLGDISGKGVSAALLVSVLHGAIRSSTTSQHEYACERINRMLCERTACERFATLFWGVFDPLTGTLRYVNAGHAAPMLVRHDQNRVERLDEGSPVLGLLPNARYSAGTVNIENSDTLILYSDGISEAANRNEEEFGEDRIEQLTRDTANTSPAEFCQRIMDRVTTFASAEAPADDRTLMVVRFLSPEAGCPAIRDIVEETVA
jgi:serine phosphatase RsbU (regulator of sigma subunit)